MATPHDRDAKLSVIENVMNVDYWAWTLIVASLIGVVLEAWMALRNNEEFVEAVAWVHMICCGVLTGYSLGAFVGVLERAPWNFGAPAVAALLAFYHLMFVKRRSHG